MTTEAEETKINTRPCPFCGCADITMHEMHDPAGNHFQLQCSTCSASTGYRSSAASALDAWNNRAPAPLKERLHDEIDMTAELVLYNAIATHDVLEKEKHTRISFYQVIGVAAVAACSLLATMLHKEGRIEQEESPELEQAVSDNLHERLEVAIAKTREQEEKGE